MSALVETARGRWSSWDVDEQPPHSSVLLALKREKTKATTAFLLDRRGDLVVVAKVARSRQGEQVLEQEAASARCWQEAGWRVARDTCPRVLDHDEGVLWLSAVPGRSMLVEYLSARHLRRRTAVTADFARAARWLDDLQLQSRGEAILLPELLALHEEAFEQVSELVPEARGLFAEALESLALACPDGVPSTAVHGDFWMGNLLVDAERVTGVVDLELSSGRGIPLLDVLKLPLSYALYLDTAGRLRPRPGTWAHLVGFEEVFLGRGHLARSAEAFVRGRLHRLGIEASALRAFFPFVLAQQALLQQHDPVSRDGYAQLLRSLARHRTSSWTWRSLS